MRRLAAPASPASRGISTTSSITSGSVNITIVPATASLSVKTSPYARRAPCRNLSGSRWKRAACASRPSLGPAGSAAVVMAARAVAVAIELQRFLGLGVRDLHHVGAEQCTEGGGDPAGRTRRDDEAGGEGGGNPEPYAVGADEELANRAPQATPARLLADLAGSGIVLEAGERRAHRARHAVLRDQPRRLVGGGRHQREVARRHALRKLAARYAKPCREAACHAGERAHQHGVAAQRALLARRVAREGLDVLDAGGRHVPRIPALPAGNAAARRVPQVRCRAISRTASW